MEEIYPPELILSTSKISGEEERKRQQTIQYNTMQ
jgi:hypothetical protein